MINSVNINLIFGYGTGQFHLSEIFLEKSFIYRKKLTTL